MDQHLDESKANGSPTPPVTNGADAAPTEAPDAGIAELWARYEDRRRALLALYAAESAGQVAVDGITAEMKWIARLMFENTVAADVRDLALQARVFADDGALADLRDCHHCYRSRLRLIIRTLERMAGLQPDPALDLG